MESVSRLSIEDQKVASSDDTKVPLKQQKIAGYWNVSIAEAKEKIESLNWIKIGVVILALIIWICLAVQINAQRYNDLDFL